MDYLIKLYYRKRAEIFAVMTLLSFLFILLGMIFQIINKNSQRVYKLELIKLQEVTSKLIVTKNSKELYLQKLINDDYLVSKAKSLGLIFPKKQCYVVKLNLNDKENTSNVADQHKIRFNITKVFADDKPFKKNK